MASGDTTTIGEYEYFGDARRAKEVVSNSGEESTPNDGSDTTVVFCYGSPIDVASAPRGGRWSISHASRRTHRQLSARLDWQALLAFALVYNLVPAVMREVATQANVDPDRVSFIDAWRWLRAPWDEPETAGSAPAQDAQPPPVIINPHRPGRSEPRVRKRRPPEYLVMTQPRAELRKILLEKSLAA